MWPLHRNAVGPLHKIQTNPCGGYRRILAPCLGILWPLHRNAVAQGQEYCVEVQWPLHRNAVAQAQESFSPCIGMHTVAPGQEYPGPCIAMLWLLHGAAVAQA